jgi:hypothetical protein
LQKSLQNYRQRSCEATHPKIVISMIDIVSVRFLSLQLTARGKPRGGVARLDGLGLGHSTPAVGIETGQPDGEMFLAQSKQ